MTEWDRWHQKVKIPQSEPQVLAAAMARVDDLQSQKPRGPRGASAILLQAQQMGSAGKAPDLQKLNPLVLRVVRQAQRVPECFAKPPSQATWARLPNLQRVRFVAAIKTNGRCRDGPQNGAFFV